MKTKKDKEDGVTKSNVEPLSLHKLYDRTLTPEQFIGEVRGLIASGKYLDFIFIATGKTYSVRIGSSEGNDLRMGDLLILLEQCKHDILQDVLYEEN